MFEKVNPSHPDKLADRIAGAIVDLAYKKEENPRIAVEVLLGHYYCHIIVETSVQIEEGEVYPILDRIAGENYALDLDVVKQDRILAANQVGEIRCGDNGIFKGTPVTAEQKELTRIAHDIYKRFPTDGKYILNEDRLIICQSNANNEDLLALYPDAEVNPLGPWTGGPNVDTGATNRKLGSDMGDGVTGGGLHGKDLSKADVSVNIYAFIQAQKLGQPVTFCCAIGDTYINNIAYAEIVETARQFIKERGGFEKFAEYGLICP